MGNLPRALNNKEPMVSAALLVSEAFNRWVLMHLVVHAGLTPRDAAHEWPVMGVTGCITRLRRMFERGWLTRQKTGQRVWTGKSETYALAPEIRAELEELYGWLSNYLARPQLETQP